MVAQKQWTEDGRSLLKEFLIIETFVAFVMPCSSPVSLRH